MKRFRTIAVTVCGVLCVAGLVAGLTYHYLARVLFDPAVFADRAATSLAQPTVARVVAEQATDQIIAHRRELTAYRPLLLGTLEYVVASPPVRTVVRRTARAIACPADLGHGRRHPLHRGRPRRGRAQRPGRLPGDRGQDSRPRARGAGQHGRLALGEELADGDAPRQPFAGPLGPRHRPRYRLRSRRCAARPAPGPLPPAGGTRAGDHRLRPGRRPALRRRRRCFVLAHGDRRRSAARHLAGLPRPAGAAAADPRRAGHRARRRGHLAAGEDRARRLCAAATGAGHAGWRAPGLGLPARRGPGGRGAPGALPPDGVPAGRSRGRGIAPALRGRAGAVRHGGALRPPRRGVGGTGAPRGTEILAGGRDRGRRAGSAHRRRRRPLASPS